MSGRAMELVGVHDALARQKVLGAMRDTPQDFWDLAAAAQLPRDLVIQACWELEESHEIVRVAGEAIPAFRRCDAFWREAC